MAEYAYPVTHTNPHVTALMYSADGKYLITGRDETLEIWDAGHTKLLQEIPGLVGAATLSRDGRHLAIAAGQRKITVWKLK